MKLSIDELDLEDSYECSMDGLRIYDGSKDGGNMLKEACGFQIPTVNVFQTTSNTAMLVFDTDSDTEYKGFKVSFKEVRIRNVGLHKIRIKCVSFLR